MKFRQLEFTTFLESSEGGNKWKVMIIEEGLSKNGKYYPRKVLESAAPLFEKSKVNFFEFNNKFFNHLPIRIENIRPEGFPLQTAGFLENVKFETVNIDGRDRSGLTGMLNLFDTEKVRDLRETLVQAWKNGLKNFLGLSINADGKQQMGMLNGVPAVIVQSIRNVISTDFVTQPAAGGGLLKLIESVNQPEGDVHMFKKFLEALKKWKPSLLEGINLETITQDELLGVAQNLVKESKAHKQFAMIESLPALIKEGKMDDAVISLTKIVESESNSGDNGEVFNAMLNKKISESKLSEGNKNKVKAMYAGKTSVKESEIDSAIATEFAAQESQATATADADRRQKESQDRLDAMERKIALTESKEMLTTKLAESKLPAPYKNKIKKQLDGKILKESEIDSIIKDERETLAALVESSSDFKFGDLEGTFIEREPVSRLQASMDLMIDGKIEESEKDAYKGVEGFKSLKEAYVAFTDDPTVSGIMGPKAMSRLHEADATTFSYALGYSMQRRMLRDYKTVDPLWRKIASVVSVPDFKLQERIRWGGFGQLPTVINARTVAGTPIDSATPNYAELGFPQDQEATYAAFTKGGMVTLTRRMIIDDDLNILTKIPGKIGRAAVNTLNRFVFDLMMNVSGTINNGTIYDGVALYAAAHKNYRTGALGFDNLRNLMDDMYHQVEFGYQTLVTDNPLTSGATTIAVTTATGQYFKAGDMLWCEGEIMLISSVSTDTLTVQRGLFGSTAAQHAQNTILFKATEILAIENPNLWIPRSLRSTALALKDSQFNPEAAEQEVNTIRDSFNPIVSPFLRGDENNYYLSAPVGTMDGIEVGFLQGKEEPELLVQDQPTQGNVFVYDTIRYKVRHEYGGAVVDFRAFAGAIVS